MNPTIDGSQWQPSQVLPLSSGIVTVPAGSGITSAVTRAINEAIPSGSRVLVRSIAVQVLNGPANQILVNLGSGAIHPRWYQRNGQSFAALGEMPVNQVLDPPGPLFLDLTNITGTTFTGASGAPVALDVVVSIDAVLLQETARGQVQHA